MLLLNICKSCKRAQNNRISQKLKHAKNKCSFQKIQFVTSIRNQRLMTGTPNTTKCWEQKENNADRMQRKSRS